MHPISIESLNRKLSTLKIKTGPDGKINIPESLIKIRINDDHFNEASLWCQRRCKHNWIWSAPTQVSWVDIYFKDEEDAIAFKLKFGSLS